MQRGFYRIASLLGEPVSPAEAYDAAAQAAADALGGDFAAVLARGAGGSSFVGGHDLRPEVRELPVPEAFADAADDGQVLAAPTSRTTIASATTWHRASFSSLLAIPVRGEQAELVLVFFDEAHAFSEDDLELAQQVARAARGAFERSRLFDAERTRAPSRSSSRARKPARDRARPRGGARRRRRGGVELLRVDAAALTSLDDRDLVVTAAAGDGADGAIGARSPLVRAAPGDVVRSRAPAMYDDASQNDSLRERDAFLAAGHAAYSACR